MYVLAVSKDDTPRVFYALQKAVNYLIDKENTYNITDLTNLMKNNFEVDIQPPFISLCYIVDFSDEENYTAFMLKWE